MIPIKPGSVGPFDLFMVFDVESIGLHGEGFAVGWVVVDKTGLEYDRGLLCSPIAEASGSDHNRKWVNENVPELMPTHWTAQEIREVFWKEWIEWRELGANLVADCPWPVEARFLARCVDDGTPDREWKGPYPFYDVASVLMALGKPPLLPYERLETESPVHNPLCDALQSARIFLSALADKPIILRKE